MRHESMSGRRGALLGASAAVLCLGGVLAACGSGGAGGGYVAVGPGGGSPGASGAAVAPSDDVSLVPLDGSGSPGSGSGGAKSGTGQTGSGEDGSTASGDAPGSASDDGLDGPGDEKSAGGTTAGGRDGSGGTAAGTGGAGSGSSSGSGSGRTGGSSGGRPGSDAGHTSAPATPAPSASARPAELGVTGTTRAGTDRRWCEKVTVSLRNTGGTAVRSGTVTFGTHIIGSLGIDWATITSTEALPAPIGAGARKDGTWTVCVDAWRVPLGMHIETRDVSVQWK